MSSKRAPGRSLDEWMELVIQCRQSGLTDAAWCNEHGISPSCFYNAVTRLRKKACQIPESANKASTLDLTSHKQDVVQIAIVNNPGSMSLLSGLRGSSAIIRYYCYIPCTSTLLQATACHIFHTLYVLSFLICY